MLILPESLGMFNDNFGCNLSAIKKREKQVTEIQIEGK